MDMRAKSLGLLCAVRKKSRVCKCAKRGRAYGFGMCTLHADMYRIRMMDETKKKQSSTMDDEI